jgi:4-hydroxybenzoate polyprenyltransferase
MFKKIQAAVRLTRWQEQLPFSVPVTVAGALMARQPLDWRLAAIVAANGLAIAYAFMINEIEDAPDDAHDPAHAARNVIVTGELSARAGWKAAGLAAGGSLVLFALCGGWSLAAGVVLLVLAHVYSWRPVRLKAWPVADVISHALMLGGLSMVSGYFVYDTNPGWNGLVMLAVTVLSAYGALYNQIRDHDADSIARLNNTTRRVGKRIALVLRWLCITGGVLLLVAGMLAGALPWWFLAILALGFATLMFFGLRLKDLRGDAVVDVSGAVQAPFIVATNVAVAVWLVIAYFRPAWQG